MAHIPGPFGGYHTLLYPLTLLPHAQSSYLFGFPLCLKGEGTRWGNTVRRRKKRNIAGKETKVKHDGVEMRTTIAKQTALEVNPVEVFCVVVG